MLFAAFAFVVLLGTVFPLIAEAINDRPVSVGPPYFNRMTVPIGIAMLLMAGVHLLYFAGGATTVLVGAPLVLPSSRNLPPPEKTSAKAAGWPDDPDVKEARRVQLERKKLHSHVEGVDDRPLRPSEMSNAPPPGRDDGKPRKSAEESAAPSSLKELGTKSIFSLSSWNSLWGSNEEYSTFAGEPTRESLVDPPPGYRTPSPNQPYGVGKEKWTPPPTDRHVQSK